MLTFLFETRTNLQSNCSIVKSRPQTVFALYKANERCEMSESKSESGSKRGNEIVSTFVTHTQRA